MKSSNYLQIKKMLLESGINILEMSKEETLKSFKEHALKLPYYIYIIILAIIDELYQDT